MKKLKALFTTPKRAILAIGCAVALLAALGTGTVFAAKALAQRDAIGAQAAQRFAVLDAGVAAQATYLSATEFTFDDGQFVYEVEFTADGVEYDYVLRASDGAILSKQAEPLKTAPQVQSGQQLSAEQAVQYALSHAGLEKADVSFTKEKLERDDGVLYYDLEFYTASAEYDYEIDAYSGAVLSWERELLSAAQPTQPGSSQQAITAQQAKELALAHAKLAAADVTFLKAELDRDDGALHYDVEFYTADAAYDYEIDAYTGAVLGWEREAFTAQPTQPTQSGTQQSAIGAERAKELALAHAGVTAEQASFTKAKLDSDDGVLYYDVEFYTAGAAYDYEIDAYTGAVLEWEKELFAVPQPTAPQPTVSQPADPQPTTAQPSMISAEQAKQLALSHAGLSAADVMFTKTKLETQDGRSVYEIEFYHGGMEYEYTIDAYSGAILEFDREYDD